MSKSREEIYDEMRSKGHYSEAEEYRETCEHNYHSISERVYRSGDAADGASFSRTGDLAERAYRDLEYEERRREEQRQEEEQEQQRLEQQTRDVNRQRAKEEEYWASQHQEQESISEPKKEEETDR